MDAMDFKKNLLSELRIVTYDGLLYDSTDESLLQAMTINQEFNTLGYTMKPIDIIKLSKIQASERCNFINNFKEILGDVKAKPMYPNFPAQVMEIDEATFRFHQLMHYFSTYGVESLLDTEVSKGWLPTVEDTEKIKSDKQLLDLKVIELININSIVDECLSRILSKNERLTIPEREIVQYAICNISDYDILSKTKITFKENLLDIFYVIFTSRDYTDTELYTSICQHTGDVWKCINFVLDECGGHFRTSQKRVLVKILESYSVEDFEANLILSNKKAEEIKKLLNFLDYNTYSRSPMHKIAVSKLRNNELQSWEGKAKELIFNKDNKALEFISKRPGMMLRMITLLLRNGFNVSMISSLLSEKAGELSTQTLVTLATHFGTEGCTRYDGEAHDEFEVMTINLILEEVLLGNLKAKNIPELDGKKAYLDFDNYNLTLSTIECNSKSEGGGYIRSGLAYKIPEDVKTMRFFVYWNDKRRVDVDLHASAITNLNQIIHVGWNGDFRYAGIVTSGDITHSDAAEFIDIDLSKSISKVNCNIDLYDGRDSFGDIDECFVGMMAVNSFKEDVKLYDPKNCFFSHYLKGTSRKMYYGYIDVTNRCLVFIGKEGKSYTDIANIKPSSMSLIKYISYLTTSHNVIYTDNKEEADIILTMEKSTDEKVISLLDNNFFMDK